jgi:hypothetical protein
VDGTDSGSCPVVAFGVNGVEPSGSNSRKKETNTSLIKQHTYSSRFCTKATESNHLPVQHGETSRAQPYRSPASTKTIKSLSLN